MQHLKVSGAVRPLKWSLGVKWLRSQNSWRSLGGDQNSSVEWDVYKLPGAELFPVTCPVRIVGSNVKVQRDSNLA